MKQERMLETWDQQQVAVQQNVEQYSTDQQMNGFENEEELEIFLFPTFDDMAVFHCQ